MDNPFHKLRDEIEEIKAAVECRVRIAISREAVSWHLSRLKDLDPEHAERYEQMSALLEEAHR